MPPRKKARTSRRRSSSMVKYIRPRRQVGTAYIPLVRQGVTDLEQYKASRYGLTFDQSDDQQKINRAVDGYRGMGAYYGGRGSYNRLNKAQRWANFAGGLMQSGRSMLSGQGDYVYNSTFPANSGGVQPTFDTVPDELGSIMVSYKEYLTDIFGNMVDETTTNNFSTVQYSIQPGLERTFPFLSQFAANFDEYDLKQCVFTYKSTINTDSSTTNGQVGSVIMATNYIVDSLPFVDKNSMLQYAGSASARVTDVSVHGVECDPEKLSGTRGKYIRSAPVLIGKDPALFDHAVFNLAISGTPEAFSNQPIGELWVEYTVCLRKPKVLTGFGQAISRDIFAYNVEKTLPTFWPGQASEILTGQQNSIGCSVAVTEQSTVKCLTITFPTWYTSPTEIKLTLTAKEGILLGTNYAAEALSLGFTDLVTTGNMTAQADMLFASDDGTPIPSAVFWSASSNNSGDPDDVGLEIQTFIVIIHVRPGTPYGGASGGAAINNTLSIPVVQELTGGQTYATLSGGFLSITEYTQMNNPGLPPVLLDANGNAASLYS